MKYLCVGAALILAGCAANPGVTSEQFRLAEQTRPVCVGQQDCELKWAAARQWVLGHASYKFQTMTNDYMETYNPERGSTKLAARIQKLPKKDGAYEIRADIWCDNMFGCIPNEVQSLIDFNRTVAAAGAK